MKNHEKAVREAAATLHAAITDARKAGFVVTWPTQIDGLNAMAISATAKTTVTVNVAAGGEVDPATITKAATAAQKAADRVVDKA